MSCRLPRCSVVALTLALLGGGVSAGAEDPDAIFGDNPAPAAKPAEESARPPLRSGKAAIEQALQQPAELELFLTPIDLVVNLLKDVYRIEVQMDRKALDDADMGLHHDHEEPQGSAPEQGVESHARGRGVDLARQRRCSADYHARGGQEVVLLRNLQRRRPDRPGRREGRAGRRGQGLAETIRHHAAARGKGEPPSRPIACSTFGTVTLLTTTQNREAHEHIAQWLANVAASWPKRTRPLGQRRSAAGRQSTRPLSSARTKVSGDYVNKPLEDAVRDLKDRLNVEIQIDKRALADVGVAANVPITGQFKDVPLRSLLRSMLGDLDLTCVGADGVLLVTTREVADARLTAKVYPSDLEPPNAGKAKPSATLRQQKIDDARAPQTIRRR